ncbi:hydrolase [Prosthecochloris sp. GSB1]|uniref:hydrolase n=1 Tax=Prosthecochloris sp. GSB1 TaxID=281093 RepID=UPI000B8C7C10|nr:hydrolase [Prosthecochloris sp. GSB1]ASQ91080.1 hydrolase [Prosthecochloris sp. GSB1]
MITTEDTVLLIIDVQGKLASLVFNSAAVEKNIVRLVKACRILGVPIICTEQYPKGLGHTVAPIRELLADEKPMEKTAFSCCADEEVFMHTLRSMKRNDVLVCGIETHICIYQTSVELIEYGYNVHLITDAVSSRTKENREAGIHAIEKAGALLKSSEMAIFELLKVAKGDAFREISAIVKD